MAFRNEFSRMTVKTGRLLLLLLVVSAWGWGQGAEVKTEPSHLRMESKFSHDKLNTILALSAALGSIGSRQHSLLGASASSTLGVTAMEVL